MKYPMNRLLLLVGLSALFAGCAVFASKSDFADYRAIRLAQTEPDRYIRMADYIQQHPTGAWAADIQARRQADEEGIFNQAKTTREGLELYLRAFPDGRFVDQARPRLAALQSVLSSREQDLERQRQEAQALQEAAELRQRQWLTRSLAFWTRTLADLQGWGQPIADVAQRNAAFSRAFGEGPAPRCLQTECVKYFQNGYAIPVPGGTRIDRQVQLALRLNLDGGRVTRVEMLLPSKGFSRWYESENRVVITDEDPTQREQALAWALERIVPAIQQAMPRARQLDNVTLGIVQRLPFPFAASDTGLTSPDDPPAVAPPTVPPIAGKPQDAPAAPTPPNPEGGAESFDLEQLLQSAAGVEAQTPTEAPPPVDPTAEPPPPPADEELPPVVVRAFTDGRVRVVVFAAQDIDYGAAFDGIVVEIAR